MIEKLWREEGQVCTGFNIRKLLYGRPQMAKLRGNYARHANKHEILGTPNTAYHIMLLLYT